MSHREDMIHIGPHELDSFAHGEQVKGQICPRCHRLSVVYNGNYFCLRDDGSSCGWVMGRDVLRIVEAYLTQRAAQAVADGDQETALRMTFYLDQRDALKRGLNSLVTL